MSRHPVPPARLRPLVLGGLLGGILVVGAAVPAVAAQLPPGGSWVRTADLLPGGSPLTVTLTPADGGTGAPVVLTEGLTDGQATDYRSVAPGSYAVAVRSASAGPGAAPIVSATYTASVGGAVTLAALGSGSAPRLAVLQDDLTAPAAGAARVRVLPALSSTSAVTVSARNGPTIATDAVFGQPTSYASVPAGAWQLLVRSATGAQTTRSADLSSGAIYTVLVVDGAAGTLQASVLQDAAGTAVAPAGGAATGGGGTATDVVGTSPAARTAGLGALTGVGLLAGVVAARRRRTAVVPR